MNMVDVPSKNQTWLQNGPLKYLTFLLKTSTDRGFSSQKPEGKASLRNLGSGWVQKFGHLCSIL